MFFPALIPVPVSGWKHKTDGEQNAWFPVDSSVKTPGLIPGKAYGKNKLGMKVREKRWKLFIPRSAEEVWDFFSRPENLNAITPEDMSFQILSDIRGVRMYEGMIIRYRISPIPGIRMHWVTEITQVREGYFFIDEQRFGPYAFWHHQHHFHPVDGGVMMEDILHYKVPFGWLGTLVDALFVSRKVEQIFSYREKAVERIFDFKAVEP